MTKFHLTVLCAALAMGSEITCGTPSVRAAQIPVTVPDAPLIFAAPSGSTIVTRKTPGAAAKHSPGWVMDVIGPPVAGFKTNFNIRTGPAEPGAVYSLTSASHMSDQFKQGFPTTRNVTFDTLTVGGEKAVSVSGTIPTSQGVTRTKIVQFAHNGTRYTFTFTAAESAFYKQVGSFDRALASIKWR